MDEKDGGLDRLCKVYEKLNDEDKEKVVRMAEGLLNTQKNGNENFRTKLDSSK